MNTLITKWAAREYSDNPISLITNGIKGIQVYSSD